MGAQPGDCMEEGSFQLAEYLEAYLSTAMSAEKIVQHFEAISQVYPALDFNKPPICIHEIMHLSLPHP